MSDAQLAEAMATLARDRRDEQAWATLTSSLWPILVAIVYRGTSGDRSVAEDLAQTTLMRIAAKYDFRSGADSAQLRAFAIKTCRRLLVDHIAASGREQAKLQALAAEKRGEGGRLDSAVRAKLDRALDVLTDSEHEMVNLLAAGVPPRRLAENLGISYEAFRTRLSRLRTRISPFLTD